MPLYRFRIVNVFAESILGGNPLCVFEDAQGLSDESMQALARQFNLSETAFLLPSKVASARVRIFTPHSEMPFAGHPTLGSAHVVRQLLGGDSLSLEMKGGMIPVNAKEDRWTLTAPEKQAAPGARQTGLSIDSASRLLGLDRSDIAGEPLWIDTGSEQLLIPLGSVDAVRRARPAGEFLERWPGNLLGRKNVYLFTFTGTEDNRLTVLARYFFAGAGGVSEDPGTGSACANLGGWLRLAKHAIPARLKINQGEAVFRPCTLWLDVTNDAIQVGGRVFELGRGSVDL